MVMLIEIKCVRTSLFQTDIKFLIRTLVRPISTFYKLIKFSLLFSYVAKHEKDLTKETLENMYVLIPF